MAAPTLVNSNFAIQKRTMTTRTSPRTRMAYSPTPTRAALVLRSQTSRQSPRSAETVVHPSVASLQAYPPPFKAFPRLFPLIEIEIEMHTQAAELTIRRGPLVAFPRYLTPIRILAIALAASLSLRTDTREASPLYLLQTEIVLHILHAHLVVPLRPIVASPQCHLCCTIATLKRTAMHRPT